MQIAPQIVVTLLQDKVGAEVVAEYPFGSWGLKSTMNLAYNLGEKISRAGKDPSAVIRIAIGDSDWPVREAIDEMIMFDAVDYRFRLGILEALFERFAPGFAETMDAKIAHLSDAERETYAEITIGSEKQIEFARGRFLEENIRERRMKQLLDSMDEVERPDVHPSVKKVAAYLLVLVPKCSVFWIEAADNADIREMILSRVSGQPRPNQSREAIRLGEQVDKAEQASANLERWR